MTRKKTATRRSAKKKTATKRTNPFPRSGADTKRGTGAQTRIGPLPIRKALLSIRRRQSVTTDQTRLSRSGIDLPRTH
jgi:hypothetical protein